MRNLPLTEAFIKRLQYYGYTVVDVNLDQSHCYVIAPDDSTTYTPGSRQLIVSNRAVQDFINDHA